MSIPYLPHEIDFHQTLENLGSQRALAARLFPDEWERATQIRDPQKRRRRMKRLRERAVIQSRPQSPSDGSETTKHDWLGLNNESPSS